MNRNMELQLTNERLNKKCGELEKNEEDLREATTKISDMLITAQANEELIHKQYEDLDERKTELEKLRIECTVVVTEKNALKKELDRVDGLYIRLQKEFREQRVQFDLIVDEVGQVSKQNSSYRGLILSNEEKMSTI